MPKTSEVLLKLFGNMNEIHPVCSFIKVHFLVCGHEAYNIVSLIVSKIINGSSLLVNTHLSGLYLSYQLYRLVIEFY